MWETDAIDHNRGKCDQIIFNRGSVMLRTKKTFLD